MAANLFSRLERFREESQVMAAHWSITQIDDHESLSQSVTYVGIELLGQLKKQCKQPHLQPEVKTHR